MGVAMKSLGFLFAFLVLLVPTILNAQVKITGVLYSTAGDRVRLTNFSASSEDVSDWWLCSLLMYAQLSTLIVDGGTLNIPPNGHLWLSGKNLNDTDADLGLYRDIMGNFGNFGDPAFIGDFVQWGSGGHSREGVAMMAGLWTAGDFVPNGPPGQWICYTGDPSTTPNTSSDWTDCILGVDDDIVSIPDKFSLAQNYPNPFNPTTTFTFSLPHSANVQLIVYDQLGQEVARVVGEQLTAGNYTVEWQAKDLPSGVYFYRLSAGEFVSTKKLVLMK